MPFVPLLEPPDDVGTTEGVRWYWVRGSEVVLVDEPPEDDAVRHFLGVLDGTPCWAADVDGLKGDPGFQSLMGLAAQLDDVEWAVAGRAVQLAEWDRTHRFCGRCASPTSPAPGERARRCDACGLLSFPRLAPAVIVLVERDGAALLARNGSFPIPMYSTIAGFVEPGETLEGAVAREVHEEVGIEVTDIAYRGSQPWPFPHSLMIGFTARWESGEIAVDGREIVDANWYGPDELPMIPPPLSIARRLIDGWLAERAD
ncbi:MAG: NAD(+) diphosphatase [Actinobacteria bacterium]|nr:NAD(+) diphosphatase [Actinomycetota bacterium]